MSLNYPAFWFCKRLEEWAETRKAGDKVQKYIYRFRNAIGSANRLLNTLIRNNASFSERRISATSMLKSFTVLHCISKTQANVMDKLGGNTPNLKILPLFPPSMPIVWTNFHVENTKLPIRFVALNIHGSNKGSDLIAKTFSQLQHETIPFRLDIHGPNPVHMLDSPYVRYHGRYHREDLDKIARNSDFCLVPSTWDETLGFTGMEMMARGVPLIVSAWAGVSEFVQNNVNGFVFDPDNMSEFYSLVKDVATNQTVTDSMKSQLVLTPAGFKTFSEHVGDMSNLFAA
ncbi:MAG: glycosyltransferase [Deltaproteobacteria bacterium]